METPLKESEGPKPSSPSGRVKHRRKVGEGLSEEVRGQSQRTLVEGLLTQYESSNRVPDEDSLSWILFPNHRSH